MKISKTLAVVALLVVLSPSLRAQATPEQILLDFLNPSVCFVTSASGKQALGKTLWYNQTSLFQRQAGYGTANVKMGLDYVSLSDRYLPFSGGDSLLMIGPSLRWQTPTIKGQLQPFVKVGMYAGYLHSRSADVKKWAFAPSVSAGVDFALGRNYTLTVDYRTTRKIEKISADGVGVSIRLNLK